MATLPMQDFDPSMIPSAQPPAGTTPNFQNPVTLVEVIVASSATTSTLAILLLCARLYSTLRVTRSAGYDDLSCTLALVFSLAYVGLIVHTSGYARHSWDLPISSFTGSYFKIILSESFLGAFGLLFSKLSILLLYFRLFSPNKRFRNFILGGVLGTILINLTSVVVAAALCAPRAGEAFGSLISIGRCARLQTWALVQGAMNVILDFYILYLPIPVIWSLNLNRNRKLGVIAIFMTGLIACIASILSLVYKARLVHAADILWNSYKVDILNIVETNVAIMVASMPACASLFRYFSSQSSLVSSMRSKLFSSEVSARMSKPSGDAQKQNEDPGLAHVRGVHHKFWRLRGTSDLENTPPQITSVKTQSGRVLDTGDFDVFNDKDPIN